MLGPVLIAASSAGEEAAAAAGVWADEFAAPSAVSGADAAEAGAAARADAVAALPIAESGSDGAAEGAERNAGNSAEGAASGEAVRAEAEGCPTPVKFVDAATGEAPPTGAATAPTRGTNCAQASGPNETWTSAKLRSVAVSLSAGDLTFTYSLYRCRKDSAWAIGPIKERPKWRRLISWAQPPILGIVEPSQELIPGRFSDRLVAYLLDTIPFTVGAVASVWAWGGPLARPITNEALLGIGAAWLGLAVLWQFAGNLAGGTPGKKLLGLAVVTAHGSFPGFFRALVRALGWVLSTPLANFGFVIALFHPRTRALHDMLSGTYVVEAGPRRSNGALLFIAAASAAVGLLALQYWTNMLRPTGDDLAAIARAENGLNVIARIEETYRAKNGTYAATVSDLAETSGDVELFRSAMLDVFRPTPFQLQAGNKGWRVVAAAKDRRNTLVRREGP